MSDKSLFKIISKSKFEKSVENLLNEDIIETKSTESNNSTKAIDHKSEKSEKVDKNLESKENGFSRDTNSLINNNH